MPPELPRLSRVPVERPVLPDESCIAKTGDKKMTATLPHPRKPAPSPSRTRSLPGSCPAAGTVPVPDPWYLAHDARNWLTVLGVYCDLLRSSGVEAGDHQQWVEDLARAVDHGRTLVLSLVERVEAPELERAGQPHGSLEVGRETDNSARTSLDVAALLARLRPLLERLAGGAIHVEVEAPAGTGTVDMPESAFERVLENLVGNAIEAMPRGGRLRICLDRRESSPSVAPGKPTPQTIVLRVQDTGVGIAPERLPHIFDPGVSGKAECAGDPHPHGLGLAIVRELIERVRGTVRVQSHPGRGTCFEVELPRQPGADLSPGRSPS